MLEKTSGLMRRISVREVEPITVHPSPHQFFLYHIEQDRLIRQTVNRAVQHQGLSGLQWLALAVMAEAGKKNMAMSEIAERIGVSQPQATAIMAPLLKAKYVKSTTDKNDKRSRLLHITLSGRRTFAKSQLLAGEAIQNLIEHGVRVAGDTVEP